MLNIFSAAFWPSIYICLLWRNVYLSLQLIFIELFVFDNELYKLFVYFGNLALNMEKAMAPHSSTLAWKIPWMEAPGRLQSMGSLRVGHD